MLRSSMNLGCAGKIANLLSVVLSDGPKALHVAREIPLHCGDQFYRQGQRLMPFLELLQTFVDRHLPPV